MSHQESLQTPVVPVGGTSRWRLRTTEGRGGKWHDSCPARFAVSAGRTVRAAPCRPRATDATGHARGRPRDRRPRASQGPAQASSTGLRRPGSAPSSPSPGPALRIAAAWRAAGWGLAACLALALGAGPAQAQSSVKLVGNTGQTVGLLGAFDSDYVTNFTTGSNALGYTLTSLDLNFRLGAAANTTEPSYTVEIWKFRGTGVLATLSNPAKLSAGNNSFTPPGSGIHLAANTTYHVILDVHTAGDRIPAWNFTASDAEDSGAATGWSIADTGRYRGRHRVGGFPDETRDLQSRGNSGMLAVHGYAHTNDTRSPEVVSATTNEAGTQLTITFDEALDTAHKPTASQAFGGSARIQVSSIAISGATLTATLATKPVSGQPLNVIYFPLNARPRTTRFQDAAGNEVLGFDKPVTNLVGGPSFASATVDGRKLEITFNEPLKAGQVPPANRFRYTRAAGAIQYTPLSAAITGEKAVTLSLKHTIAAHETVTVSYVAPAANPRLQDTHGNAADSFANRPVRNGTGDVLPPTVVDASTSADGAEVYVVFSEEIAENSVVDFTLKVNDAERVPFKRNVSGDTVTLRYSDRIRNGQRVTLSYSSTHEDRLRDRSGNYLEHFPDMEVRNLVLAPATIQSVEITSTPSTDSDTPADGTPDTYQRKEDIEVTVTWDKDVTWDYSSGTREQTTLAVRLRIGTSPERAELVTGGAEIGTARAFVFRYRVDRTDVDADGIAVEAVNGELVTKHFIALMHAADGSGVNPAHAGLSADADHKVNGGTIDSTAPAVSTRSIDGATLTVTYDERLRESSVPDKARFTVRVANEGRTVDAVDVSGKTVVLTLASPARAGQTATVTYAASGTPIEDLAGNDAPSFTNQSVSNDTAADVTAPKFVSATVDASTLIITFDEALDSAHKPEGRFLLVAVNGSRIPSRSTVAINGETVTLGLDIIVRPTELVSIAYNPVFVTQANQRLQDATGNEVAAFDSSVTNLPATVPPTVNGATVSGTTLTLTFDKALEPATKAGGANTLRFAFFLDRNGHGSQHPSSVSIGISAVTLTLPEVLAPKPDDPFRLTYDPSLAEPGDRLKGATPPKAGADLPEVEAFSNLEITNATAGNVGAPTLIDDPDEVAQVFARGAATGDPKATLRLFFSEPLDPSSAPAGSAFQVRAQVNGAAERRVNGTGTASIIGSEVEVTLAKGLDDRSSARVLYTKPDSNPLQDLEGNEVHDFGGFQKLEYRVTVIDEQPPTRKAASVAGSRLTISYHEALDPGSVPLPGDFKVKVGADDRDVSRVGIVGNAVVLTLASAAGGTDAVTFRYGAGAHPIRDTAGNNAPNEGLNAEGEEGTLPAIAVTNAGSTDPGKPTLKTTNGAVVNGPKLTLSFSQELDPGAVPSRDAFQLDGDRAVDIVRIRVATVELILNGPVYPCDTVTLSYVKPSEKALQNVWGTQVDAISNQAVTNARASQCTTVQRTSARQEARGKSFSMGLPNGLGPNSNADGRDFSLTATPPGGPARRIRGRGPAVIHQRRVDVRLASALTHGETVTVSYRRPAGAVGLWDANGNQMANFANEPVVNQTPGGPPLTAEFIGVPAEHEGRFSEFSFELRFSENFPGRLPYKVLKDQAIQVGPNARVIGATRVAQGQNQRWTITVRPRSMEDVTVSLPATTDCGAPRAVCTESGRPLSNSNSATVSGPVGISVADARVEEGAGAVLAFAVTLSRAATSRLTVDYATSDGSARAGEDYTAASGTLTFQAGDTSATIEVGVLDDAHDEGEETLTLRLSNATGGKVIDGEATGTIENKDLIPAALLARFGRATAEQVVTRIEERMAAPRQRGLRARFAGREFQPGSERDFALGFLSSFTPMGTAGAAPMGAAPMGAAPMGAAPMGAAPMGGAAMGAAPMGGIAMGGTAPMGMGSHTAGPGAPGAGVTGARGMTGTSGVNGMGMGNMTGSMGMAGQQPPMGHGPAADAHEPGVFSTMVGYDPLSNSEFELNRDARGGTLSLWSRNSRSHFSGMDDALSLNGDVRTSMFGADWARGPLTVGLSVGRTLGLGGYSGPSSGQMTTSMTGFYPWVGYQVNERVSVWGVTGYGTGMLSLTPGSAAALETGVSMAMTAVGTRGELIGSRTTGGFALAFKADALWVGVGSELLDGPTGRLNASEAGVTRVRTALEGSRGYTMGDRVSLTPSVEVGLRQDGGDAETGAGMDVGGGLAFTDTVTGLSLDVRVRTLVVHQAEGFSERGMSLSFGWDPTPSSPLGLTARVAPSWGGQAQGGADALWGNQMTYGTGSHQMHEGGERVDAEVGYGLPVGARFVGTPKVGVSTSAYGRDYRVGYGLGVLEQGKVSFELAAEAQRREIPMQGEASNGLLGRAAIGW